MTDTLDQLVRDAAPISDEAVRALDLGDLEEQLRNTIVTQPRSVPRAPRRALRWGLSGAGVATAVGVTVAVISLGGGGERLGPGPERAWAAPVLRVANAVPRLLVGEQGWAVTRADQFTVGEGEMTFARAGRSVDLHWRSGTFADWRRDRAASTDTVATVEVLGASAEVFLYKGTRDDFTTLWKRGRYTMELRAGFSPGGERMTLDEYRAVLGSLREAGVDEWLSAMPASVVKPADAGKAVDEMLAGIELPPGFDPARLKRGDTVRDRYQLGAYVAGAVACAWIARWVDGDGDGAAAKAMAGSRDWPILREMNAAGDYPEVLWQYADALQVDGMVTGGKPISVASSYRQALGC